MDIIVQGCESCENRKEHRLGRSRHFLLALSCGGLVGLAVALTAWFQKVLANSYLEHGMLRISFQCLVSSWNPAVLGCSIFAAGLWAISMFFLHHAKWPMGRVARVGAEISLVSIAFVATDWGLQVSTGFSLGMAASRTLAKAIGLASGELGLGQIQRTLVANLKGGILLAVGMAVAILFIFLIWKLPWGRLLTCLIDRSRRVLGAGLAIAAMTLAINILHGIDASSSRASGPNVIMITVDCLRHDHVGYSGYSRDTSPNIDKLARHGVVFSNAYSNAPWTKPSVGTLFTSLFPPAHTTLNYVSILPAEVITLAEILKDKGYHTVYLNSENPFITRRFGFHQGFDIASDSGTERDAAQLTDALLKMLPSLHGRRFFAYLHYMDLHLPYSENGFHLEFAESVGVDGLYPGTFDAGVIRKRASGGQMPERTKDYIRALYDGQLRYVDMHLGRLFDRVASDGLVDETLIVLLADHGEEFWEHGNFEHGHTLYEELLRVPVVLSGLSLQGSTVDSRVSLVDLMPTVLELIGIGSENLTLHGESLGAVLRGTADSGGESPVYAAGTLYGREKYCVIRGQDKLIVNTDVDSYKLELDGYACTSPLEVYCLHDDPLEKANLGNGASRTANELSKLVEEFMRLTGPGEAEKTFVDDELKAKLKSVGYL